MRAAAGFTLIEVIVALVILSGIMVGFYEFLSASFTGADRARDASLAYDREQNALELASALNPMETPEGTFALGGYRIHWVARRIGAVRQSVGYPAGRGRFAVALYRVALEFSGTPRLAPLTVTELGFRREPGGE